MVDLPNQQGKMCHWPRVEAIFGAFETLLYLSQQASIYIATNAADSTEYDIHKAFERVHLSAFISGYFCRDNLGLSKESGVLFYQSIVQKLKAEPSSLTMVGDNLDRDIMPAIEAGLEAIWFRQEAEVSDSSLPYQQIRALSELCKPTLS